MRKIHRRRHSSRQTAHQRRFAAAARACKGTGKVGGATRTACMRKHLKAR